MAKSHKRKQKGKKETLFLKTSWNMK